MDRQHSGTPRWIVIATAVVGLLAGIILVGTRIYELRKARAEASLAEAKSAPALPDAGNAGSIGNSTTKPSPKPKEPDASTQHPSKSGASNPPTSPEVAAPAKPTPSSSPPVRIGRPRVKVETTHGSFTVELNDQVATKTVEAFLALVRSNSFDGTRLMWATLGNRQTIDKDKKAAAKPMAANVRLAPKTALRWLDPVPTDTFARRGDLCIDQRYGENDVRLVITQVQGAVPGRFPFGRVVEGWETVDKLCDGHSKKDGLPSLFLDTVEVRIKTIRELSSE